MKYTLFLILDEEKTLKRNKNMLFLNVLRKIV